jgi:hypothetical protein
MPGGDRTGPGGYGPLTGRRRGFCADDNVRSINRRFGYGRGYGGGFGRTFGNSGFHRGALDFSYGRGYGYGNRGYYHEDIFNASEKTVLENQINVMKEQLASMEKELSYLKNES